MCTVSFIPRPLPLTPFPRGEAWYTLLARAHIIFHIKFRPLCPYAGDYTNQEYRAFLENRLPTTILLAGIVLEYYFSDMAASFFQT